MQVGGTLLVISDKICPTEDRDYDGISTDARTFGETYLVDGMLKVYENSVNDKADQSTVGENAKFVDNNNRVLTNLSAEHSAALRKNKNGDYYVDMSTEIGVEHPSRSPGNDVGFGDIHTHPNEGKRTHQRRAGGYFPATFEAGPSEADWNGAPANKYDVVVEKNTIYFYGYTTGTSLKRSEIKIPTSYFPLESRKRN